MSDSAAMKSKSNVNTAPITKLCLRMARCQKLTRFTAHLPSRVDR